MEKYSCISFQKIIVSMITDDIIDMIYAKFGIIIEVDYMYKDITLYTHKSHNNDYKCLTVFDTDLSFKELMLWSKSVLDDGIDTYKDRYVCCNLEGRTNEKEEKINSTEEFDVKSNISGFEIPLIRRSSTIIKENTPFQVGVFYNRLVLQAQTYLYPEMFVGNLGITVVYTSMTSDEIINWMNAIINGHSLYNDKEIILDYNVDEASEKTKKLLSNCKMFSEFKNELNS